jgi:hypothetical protein
VAVAAGLAALELVDRLRPHEALERSAATLADGEILGGIVRARDIQIVASTAGAIRPRNVASTTSAVRASTLKKSSPRVGETLSR